MSWLDGDQHTAFHTEKADWRMQLIVCGCGGGARATLVPGTENSSPPPNLPWTHGREQHTCMFSADRQTSQRRGGVTCGRTGEANRVAVVKVSLHGDMKSGDTVPLPQSSYLIKRECLLHKNSDKTDATTVWTRFHVFGSIRKKGLVNFINYKSFYNFRTYIFRGFKDWPLMATWSLSATWNPSWDSEKERRDQRREKKERNGQAGTLSSLPY